MTESNKNDLDKWASPTNGGEVARGLLQARIGLVDLHNMIYAMKTGDEAAYEKARLSYLKADEALRELINEIGGLSGE